MIRFSLQSKSTPPLLSLSSFILSIELSYCFHSDPWKKEEVYLVQYAAVGSLGLLLRSNPGTLSLPYIFFASFLP
jgi:hypothetical protein